jgi:hypothetical protein
MEALSFEGNPVAGLPNYRLTGLALLGGRMAGVGGSVQYVVVFCANQQHAQIWRH